MPIPSRLIRRRGHGGDPVFCDKLAGTGSLRISFLDPFGDFPSATNNVRPTQGGAAAAARRRHGLEVEDEGLLKDFVVIFVFLGVLCTVRCFF
jgi:hypothetical protein